MGLRSTLRRVLEKRASPSVNRLVRQAWFEVRVAALHQRSVRRAGLVVQDSSRLHLGCGWNRKPGWVNVDVDSGCDLQLDLRRPLPIADDTVSEIYSEHLLEHLAYPADAVNLLRECFRVLRPGGVISVGVPDAGQLLLAYAKDDTEYIREAWERWEPEWCSTAMDSVNYTFRQDGAHQYAYDEETLAGALNAAGFTAIARRDFDPRRDQEARRGATLYMDARKPPG
jgi:predicted SAM-dependent methyltransferase